MKIRIQLSTLISISIFLIFFSCKSQNEQKTEIAGSSGSESSSTFKGEIKLDVRDSKADWEPYIRKKAPEGSPNILFIFMMIQV